MHAQKKTLRSADGRDTMTITQFFNKALSSNQQQHLWTCGAGRSISTNNGDVIVIVIHQSLLGASNFIQDAISRSFDISLSSLIGKLFLLFTMVRFRVPRPLPAQYL